MTAEQYQLLSLVDDYKAAVAKAVVLLNTKSEKEKGFQVQQDSPGHYAGYLDDLKRIRYALHGIGCLVTTPEFEVDFDFGEAGRCDGIDAWFLFKFLVSNEGLKARHALLTSDEQVRQLLQELEEAGLMIRFPDLLAERLYYLATDIHNPNPPTVKFYLDEETDF